MVRIVVGDEQRLAKERLSLAPWKWPVQILRAVVKQLDERFAVPPEGSQGSGPFGFLHRTRRFRPITGRPLRRDMVGRPAELENIVLRDAHVFEQFPG